MTNEKLFSEEFFISLNEIYEIFDKIIITFFLEFEKIEKQKDEVKKWVYYYGVV